MLHNGSEGSEMIGMDFFVVVELLFFCEGNKNRIIILDRHIVSKKLGNMKLCPFYESGNYVNFLQIMERGKWGICT